VRCGIAYFGKNVTFRRLQYSDVA